MSRDESELQAGAFRAVVFEEHLPGNAQPLVLSEGMPCSCRSSNAQPMGGNIMSKNVCIIGVSDHGGWAVLVTVARDGTLLDRRRVELVDEGLPKLPHHHDAQGLPVDEAVALVESVRVSAERHAALALDAVTMAVPRISGVALRNCPPLPATIAERIKNYRAQNVADWVMYRKALASAAEARGWPVHWYDAKKVWSAANQALRVENLEAHFLRIRRAVGPPWDKDHKLAMAAAIVTAKAFEE
jgi:hypothetical protein